jgi:hypothetical protein
MVTGLLITVIVLAVLLLLVGMAAMRALGDLRKEIGRLNKRIDTLQVTLDEQEKLLRAQQARGGNGINPLALALDGIANYAEKGLASSLLHAGFQLFAAYWKPNRRVKALPAPTKNTEKTK